MKKILFATVASAFVMPVAMADVTVYGFAATGVEYSKISDNGPNDLTRARLVDYDSRIGFKGADKLDNGMQLYWQVENKYYTGSGDKTGYFGDRDTLVKLKGNFGEILVGKFYDVAGQTITNVAGAQDSWTPGLTYSLGTGNSAAGLATTFNAKHAFGAASNVFNGAPRVNNAIQYSTPNIQGFKGKVLYDFGAKTSAYNHNGMQASLGYKSKLFNLGGAYKQVNDSYLSANSATAAEDYYKNYVIGGNIQPIDKLNISALWNRVKARSGSDEAKQDGWAIGVNYAMGKHGMGVHYAKVGDYTKNGNKVGDSGAYGVAAHYFYFMSKQTRAFVAASLTRNDKNAGLQMQASTSLTSGITVANGSKTTLATAGIRTDF
ncbi:porin [Formivibrio citricus]|nr:porin [Formivibrio citricus]